MDKKTHQKKNGGNAFYIVLSLCLIAVGVAAWSAVSAFSDFNKNNENITPQIESPEPTPEVEAPVTSELPKVEYEKKEEQNKPTKTEPQETNVAEYFLMPISNGNILKNFDETALQYSKTMGDMRLHLGIDIEAAKETVVKSAGKGKVSEIYDDANFGYTVVIDHGNGIVAKYCGLSTATLVAVNDTVDAGTEIGYVADIPCESADESHLHFEMYKDGKAVSPLKTMNME